MTAAAYLGSHFIPCRRRMAREGDGALLRIPGFARQTAPGNKTDAPGSLPRGQVSAGTLKSWHRLKTCATRFFELALVQLPHLIAGLICLNWMKGGGDRGRQAAAVPVRWANFYCMVIVKPWGPMFNSTPCCTAYRLITTPFWFCMVRPAWPPARAMPAPTATYLPGNSETLLMW